jgi:hypothetical protein
MYELLLSLLNDDHGISGESYAIAKRLIAQISHLNDEPTPNKFIELYNRIECQNDRYFIK